MEVPQIIALQKSLTQRWHVQPAEFEPQGSDLAALIERNHLENFRLWHEEDIARRDDLGAERIRLAKRAIDRFNQRRNDLVECMDRWLVEQLQPRTSGCPFNSETPGMIIDRLSILALKDYHMHEEAVRADATPEHREHCMTRLQTIRRQITDLSQALTDLLQQVHAGTRSFRVYYQFKMYNDAQLNPELRRAA